MKTITLTEKDFVNGVYRGKVDVNNIKGNLEIEKTGRCHFETGLLTSGYIHAIGNVSAKGRIMADDYIFVKGDIRAGDYIFSVRNISSTKGNIIAGTYIGTRGRIHAGNNIYTKKGGIGADGDICAGGDIVSADYLHTRGGEIISRNGLIKAKNGITAYYRILAKKTIKCDRILAGVAPYGWLSKKDGEIRCKKLVGGKVEHGYLVITK